MRVDIERLDEFGQEGGRTEWQKREREKNCKKIEGGGGGGRKKSE